jgi:hypothetical protein
MEVNMKKITLFLLIALTSFSVFSQNSGEKLNPWSIGLSVGDHFLMGPIDNTTLAPWYAPGCAQLDGKYMFNGTWGIMLKGEYNIILHYHSKDTHIAGGTVEAIADLGNATNFSNWTKIFGLYAHGGIGGDVMWRPGITMENNLFKNADEMITLSIGVTPYFKVNENWTVNIDYSYRLHFKQNRYYNMDLSNDFPLGVGYMRTLSVGISYHFGNNSAMISY